MVQFHPGNHLSMQTCSRLLEPRHSRSGMHQPTSFWHCQWRVQSHDGRLDTLSSHSYGLGFTYQQGAESHSNRHIPVRGIVSVIDLSAKCWTAMVKYSAVCVLFPLFVLAKSLMSTTTTQHGVLWTYMCGQPGRTVWALPLPVFPPCVSAETHDIFPWPCD